MNDDVRVACKAVDIADAALDPAEALAFVNDPAFGGIDVFIGRVRSANHGRIVTGIHYDMFDPLALKVFARSAQSAVDAHGPNAKVYVAHAKGRLRVGDTAVIVAFATPHRDAAFRGCRDVIEAVKHEAPIWKQEHYVDGSSEWSEGCALCVEAADARIEMSAPPPTPVVASSHACACAGHAHRASQEPST
ncbi:MAG: molybdenum cofactor biosynthesis protein MoaE [Pseudomonadota bacterium]|jgi:molybdopterin synthase catalytic subunit